MSDAPLMRRLVSIRSAARSNGKGYAYVKRLVESGKLRAFVMGHQKNSPILGVLPEEAQRAIEDEMQYIPKAGKPQRRASRPAFCGSLDPAVRC